MGSWKEKVEAESGEIAMAIVQNKVGSIIGLTPRYFSNASNNVVDGTCAASEDSALPSILNSVHQLTEKEVFAQVD